MVDDLTKLSGPELAAIIRGAWVVNDGTPPLSEALRRAEEDDRVWQRRLEHERDGLRERLEAEMRKPIPVVRLEAGDAYVAELLREREILRARVTGLECTCDQLRASCNNQRKELHSLNVERKATLTKLEDAQKRIAELEAQRELDAGSLRSAINNAQSRLAQVKRLEAQLRIQGYPVTGDAGGAVVEMPAERKAIAVGDKVRKHGWPDSGIVKATLPGGNYHYVEWATGTAGDYHSSELDVLRPAMSETAERKAQEERRYGMGESKLSEITTSGYSSTAIDLATHLRETLATIDAVRALAVYYEDRAKRIRNTYDASCVEYHAQARTLTECADDIREVINAKK